MAKGRGKGRPFQKGNKAGKGHGRPPLPADLKQARSLNRIEFERIANKYLYMSPTEFEAELQNPARTAIETMVMAVVSQCIKDGCVARLNAILDRVIGKPAEPPQLHTHLNFNMMPRRQAAELGRQAIEFLERARELEDEVE